METERASTGNPFGGDVQQLRTLVRQDKRCVMMRNNARKLEHLRREELWAVIVLRRVHRRHAVPFVVQADLS